MKALIKATLKVPLTRTAAALSTLLVGQGIPQDQAQAVASGLVAGVFVCIDLVYLWRGR